MNVGDYVYVYLFDLSKSILKMNKLRNDRFGRIIRIENRTINNKPTDVYMIKLLSSDTLIELKSNDENIHVITIDELINVVNSSNCSEELKSNFLIQIQTNIN